MNRRVFLAGLLALPGSASFAQESATTFVQRFYDSYLKQDAPRWGETVRLKPGLFDPALAKALRDDAAAQAKVQGDIVGLDFDPFLGSQDPGPKFVARRAAPIPGGTRVEVFDLLSPAKPMALVDLAPRGGSWVITGVRYPNLAGDLTTILKALAKARVARR